MDTRRTFLNRLTAATAMLYSRLKLGAGSFQRGPSPPIDGSEWEYIVVGSGAGGGTVAARLAELGHRVLVLEAGGDPMESHGGNALYPEQDTIKEDYEVPAFHPNSTENNAIKWDFFVRHYVDLEKQKRDKKYCPTYQGDPVDGVLYPRAGTLGGCTAHNAMILVYPHNKDWQDIADATGDPSWSPANMRKYFEKLEDCHHRPFERFLHALTRLNLTRHGFGGWLQTERALPLKAVFGDKELADAILNAVKVEIHRSANAAEQVIEDIVVENDPNDWLAVETKSTGIRYTPLTTKNHARTSTRERLLEVQKRLGSDRLHIEKDALATKVRFEGKRATGVEYLKGKKLYRPHGKPTDQGTAGFVRASREVILCGGAFNTPQLLMLSGIGPEDQLTKWKIDPVRPLEGVGKNLQDRYEIGVVHQADRQFTSLSNAHFRRDDKPYREWKKGQGIYTTNGAALVVIRKSFKERPLPDLFCFALIGNFHGYYPTYSKLFKEQHDRLTWAILKAHTLNHGGRVTLESTDPRIAPHVNFHYFEEGTDAEQQDLDSVVAGIKFVRELTRDLAFMKEEIPGPLVEKDEELRDFVRDNAWGHHASCTCPIGDEQKGGVLDKDFKVHGVDGLRVVDASIFPKIPGFFIVSSIYMAAEKAAEVIHANA